MDFVNLHTHSMFSIRDAVSKIDELINRAIELKYESLALTDHGTMAGIIEFYKIAKSKNFKPIIGCELYVAPNSRFIKDNKNRYHHLTVIAMNNTGYRNLCTLVSESYKSEHFYYKPRIDKELLRIHNEGLIVLSGCLAGHLASSILVDQQINFTDEDGNELAETIIECADCQAGLECQKHSRENPRDVALWYKSVFKDRYYIEIQNHGIPEEDKVRDIALQIARDLEIKVVATGDTHFVKKEDVVSHNVMLAIRNGNTIYDEGFSGYPGSGYYLPDTEYLNSKFNQEYVSNTLEISERCNVNLEFGNYKLPLFTGHPMKEDEEFVKWVVEGLKQRFNNSKIPKKYSDRIKEEISTIMKMGFSSYFLVVADYVNWAKKNGILVGPSRGSAGGSLVSYAMGITEVDPIKYDLSFSRFLNKGRSSIPLIDFKEFPFEEWKKNNGKQ